MTCPSCGAALADDQRYCLNCGQRQGEPRVDFQRHLDSEDAKRGGLSAKPGEQTAPASPVLASDPEKRQRDYAPLAAAGGIAVLGIMLLIGVLIGRGTGSDTGSSAPPQVVTVAAGDSSSAGSGDEAEASGGTKKKAGGKSGKKKATANSSPDTGNAPVASDEQLEALQGKTGQEYAEESAKLPDEIATPGQAPPTDGKTPGGGSGGVTLE